MNRGIMLPNGMGPQQPVMQISAPMNDIQLIAMIAAHKPDLPPMEAVAWAADVLVEAVAAAGMIEQRLRQRMEPKRG